MTIDAGLIKQALDTLDEIFFIFAVDGPILQWNQRAVEVTGYSDEEIAQMDPGDFVPGLEKEHFHQQLNTVLEKGHSRFRTRIQTKEGRLLPYEITSSLLEREDQQLICGTGRNISNQLEAQEALRKSERKYRHLFEESRDGIVIQRYGEGREINPAGVELLGYTQEEFKRIDLRSIYVNPEQRDERLRLLDEQGYVRDFETAFRRKDGQERICLMTSSHWHDPQGHVEGRITIFRDVTEQKQAEQALRESEEKFRTLAEKSPVGIGLVQDGVYRYANPALAEIFEYSQEKIIGWSVEETVHPDDRAKVRENIRKRISGEVEAVHYSFRGQTRSGKTVYLEAHGARITYKDKPAIVGTVVDVTEQRRLQQEILRVQEEERRRIGQDLHDGVASQLTGLAMMVSALAERVKQEKALEANELERIAALLRDTGQETRFLSHGLNPVHVSRESLSTALQKLAQDTEKQTNVNCSFKRSGRQPQFEEEIATHLYRIAQEAVQNAVKHAGATRIEIHLATTGEEVELTISDDGEGIADPGTRSEGMGLRSMNYRANLAGGALHIDQAANGGTAVRIRLST